MSKRAPTPGFGDRFKRVRLRMGYLKRVEFARKLGINPGTYRKWEELDSAPSPQDLKKAIKLLGVAEWQALFLWLCDGSGEPPTWLEGTGDVPLASAEETKGAPPVPQGARVKGPLPWRAIELVAQQARAALERGDTKEATNLESDFFHLVAPYYRPA